MHKRCLLSAFIFLSIITNAQLVPLDSVSNYIDQVVTVYGQVVDGRYLQNSNRKPTLLNMGAKFPDQKMTIVIYGDDRNKFGFQPEIALINKTVYVKGKVQLYNNRPQIVVSSPFEISFNPPDGETASDDNNREGQRKGPTSKVLQTFTESDVSGFSCYIYSNPGDISKRTYYVAVNYSADWTKRVAFLKYANQMTKLQITNSSVKDGRCGVNEYFEVYKNQEIEVRIDYKKSVRTGPQTDIYNVVLTIKYRGEKEKITTRAVCSC